jgi:hypothetical protein
VDIIEKETSVVLGFDLTSWYGLLLAAALGYVFWTSVFETGHRHYRWIKSRFWPEPPEPPVIIIEGPGFTHRAEPIIERRLKPRAYLTHLDAYYRILNKDGTQTVTSVSTGIRRKDDGREHTFPNFSVAALAPSEATAVMHVSIPESLFDGLTEEDFGGAFLFWARFTTAPGGARWEIVHDSATAEHSSSLLT